MATITTDSQIAYLFARLKDLEALVRYYEYKTEEQRDLIHLLQVRCDTFSDAIIEALHGKTLDESYEQAFDRVMGILDETDAE